MEWKPYSRKGVFCSWMMWMNRMDGWKEGRKRELFWRGLLRHLTPISFSPLKINTLCAWFLHRSLLLLLYQCEWRVNKANNNRIAHLASRLSFLYVCISNDLSSGPKRRKKRGQSLFLSHSFTPYRYTMYVYCWVSPTFLPLKRAFRGLIGLSLPKNAFPHRIRERRTNLFCRIYCSCNH